MSQKINGTIIPMLSFTGNDFTDQDVKQIAESFDFVGGDDIEVSLSENKKDIRIKYYNMDYMLSKSGRIRETGSLLDERNSFDKILLAAILSLSFKIPMSLS